MSKFREFISKQWGDPAFKGLYLFLALILVVSLWVAPNAYFVLTILGFGLAYWILAWIFRNNP
jgi:hypothetical protein